MSSRYLRTGGGSWLRFGGEEQVSAVWLLCFPHAGAGASSFNAWRRYLPPEVGLVAVQLPGREDNRARPPFVSVPALLAELYPHIEPLLERPLACYGHSMGAIVAFEVARELRRRGQRPPVCLFVSGRRAPDRPLRRPGLSELPEAALIEQLRRMGGLPAPWLDAVKWRRHFLPTIRADLALSDRYGYRPEHPLACPIYAFLGSEDRVIDRRDWEAWQAHTTATFARWLLPGGHHISRAHQQVLTHAITELLRQHVAPERATGARPECDERPMTLAEESA